MELLIKQLEELISPNEWFVTNLSNAMRYSWMRLMI